MPRPSSLTARAPRRYSLSVCIICRDEADRIEQALKSVSGWADEIVVFDSGSTDETTTIVRRYTDRLFVTDWPGFGAQRQRCLEAAAGDWVLVLDADERVTVKLREEIDALLAGEPGNIAVQMCWRLVLFGKPLRFAGRFSAPQTRLFPRRSARFGDQQWVHETPMLETTGTRLLEGRLEHVSFRNYQQLAQKHLDYGCLLAQIKQQHGRRATMPQAELRALLEFLNQYFVRGLALEGSRGLLLASVLAQYAFHKYAALYVATLPREANDIS